MTRSTIDFGIDLGTTNSAIALLEETRTRVFRNEGAEYTPSAVWMDKGERLVVGKTAKKRQGPDEDNAFVEFKLQMGTDTVYTFARNGRQMTPEELSSEVLKSLRKTAYESTHEDCRAAVITVPAAFDLPECKATNRAAELAGFTVSPLLQEPVAAAMAYGFQSESDGVFWLVYDLGGGTFDAAIIQVRDGLIEVTGHGGDRHLGGKLIDDKVVNELLIPAVTQEWPLSDFYDGNPAWKSAMAKLKRAAEEAKIRLSHDESAFIEIDYLCEDDRGNRVEFEYSLTRAELVRLAEPIIRRSLNITKKVLAEKALDPGDIEKVLLVGGPTLMPCLRERLADSREGLGIPLEFGVDPLTVVAKGAAIFAGTQRLEIDHGGAGTQGLFVVELEYEPVGPEIEPHVGGRVVPPEGSQVAGHTIEFVNTSARQPWRSGRLDLSPKGTFMTTLWAETGRRNTFRIELYDPTGTRMKAQPETFPYTVGKSITDPPLIHSVGVWLADGSVQRFFEKGSPLPIRKRRDHQTVFPVEPGMKGPVLRIPVVEGENPRADRNREIGTVEILADAVQRELPAGSDVEITIEIDASRQLRTTAFIPILDEHFEDVSELRKKNPSHDDLATEVEKEKDRLERARRKSRETGDPAAASVLERIDEERMVHEVETFLTAASARPEEAGACQERLLDLKCAIDDVEAAVEWPSLVAEAENELSRMREVTEEYGDAAERRHAATLEEETLRAAASEKRNADLLRQKVREVNRHTYSLLRKQPGFWVTLLRDLEEMKDEMREPAQADQWFSQGLRAINNNDIAGLTSAVQQLLALLPEERQEQIRGTTMPKGS